jgi:IS5 family transposase
MCVERCPHGSAGSCAEQGLLGRHLAAQLTQYRLGYETVCAEVSGSISWRLSCKVPLGAAVPHPSTLEKITSRCGEEAIAGLNEALLKKRTKRSS